MTPGQKLAEAMNRTGLPYKTFTARITPEMEETDKWIRDSLHMINEANKSAKRAKIVFKTKAPNTVHLPNFGLFY